VVRSQSKSAGLGCSPDTATAEDVRRYQVDLTESGVHVVEYRP